MKDREPILTTVEQRSFEKRGLQVLTEDIIQCANCHESLIQILKVKENPSKTYIIIAECPFCNDTSFRYKVDGDIYMSSVDKTVIDDIIMENKDGAIHSKVKVIKNVKI